MTLVDEITGYEYTPQELPKQSRLARGLMVATSNIPVVTRTLSRSFLSCDSAADV